MIHTVCAGWVASRGGQCTSELELDREPGTEALTVIGRQSWAALDDTTVESTPGIGNTRRRGTLSLRVLRAGYIATART